MTHILCLDIDGVLHPADRKVLLDFNAPGWLLSTQARSQGLFCWVDELNRCIEGTDVQLLVHSTWRRRVSDRVLQDLLGPDLAPRTIVTWMNPDDRITLSHAAYINSVLKAQQEGGVSTQRICVLDDRPDLFEEDQTMLEAWSPVYIWAEGATGLSDPLIQTQLTQWTHDSLQESVSVNPLDGEKG